MNEKQVYPGIGGALVLLFIVIVLILIISVVMNMVLDSSVARSPYSLSAVNAIAITLVIYMAYKRTGRAFFKLFPLKALSGPLLFVLAVACISMTVIFSEVDNIFRYFFPIPESIYRLFADIYLADDLVSSIVLLGIVAPLTEEFLFRGVILNGFLKNYSVQKAVIVSALLFGLIHLNPWQFLSGFAGGIYLGWLYYRTENLLTCIFVHSFYNLFPLFVIRYVDIEIQGYNALSDMMSFQPLWFDLAGIGLLVVSIIFTVRIADREDKNS